MAWDFDFEMLIYLGMITAGFFMAPIASSPPYFMASGIALIGAGFALVFRKVRKK